MSAEKLAERGQQSSRLRTVPSEELAARCGTPLCGDRRVEPADEAFVDDTHIHMIESCATWILAFRASDSFNAASDCDLCESRGIDFEAVNLQDSWGGPVGVRKSYDHLARRGNPVGPDGHMPRSRFQVRLRSCSNSSRRPIWAPVALLVSSEKIPTAQPATQAVRPAT